MNRAGILVAPLFVGAAILVALMGDPESMLLLGAACLLLLLGLLLRSRGPGTKAGPVVQGPETEGRESFVEGTGAIVMLALLVRFVGVIVVNATPLWLSFGPDSLHWEFLGHLMYASWQGETLPPGLDQTLEDQRFFVILNAVSVAIFDSARYPVAFLNCFGGILVAYLVGTLAQQIYGTRVARRAFVIILFYPSLLLWSTMNLREVWSQTAILAALVSANRARQRLVPFSLAVLVASIFAIYMIRPYLAGLVLLSVFASMFVVRLRQLPYAMVALTALAVLLTTQGDAIGITEGYFSEERLIELQRLRQGLAYGGSAYGREVDTRTIGGALAYLPIGVVNFLFAPLPWNVRSLQQLIALPESLLFLFITLQAIRQGLGDLISRASAVAPSILTIVILTSSYGLVSGNEGTAFRHRAQVVVIVVVLAAARQVSKRREGDPGEALTASRGSLEQGRVAIQSRREREV